MSGIPDDYIDPVVAAADLVGRSGAIEFELGWAYDDDEPPPGWPPGVPVPLEAQGWYATARYQGARLTGEGATPSQAAERLARRVLNGAKCAHCHRPVHLDNGFSPPPDHCVWHRSGHRWAGCQGGYGIGKSAFQANRRQRRAR